MFLYYRKDGSRLMKKTLLLGTEKQVMSMVDELMGLVKIIMEKQKEIERLQMENFNLRNKK